MNQKTLIILVVILVVLFFCGMGPGIFNDLKDNESEPFDLDVGWIKGIGNLFGPKISKDDIVVTASTCPLSAIEATPLALAQNTNCIFRFGESNTRARILKVRLAVTSVPVGLANYVPFPVDNSDFPVTATLVPASAEISLSVRQKGGVLTFACQPFGTCVFWLNAPDPTPTP